MQDNPISSTGFEEILNIQFEQPDRRKQLSYGLKFVKSFWGSNYGSTDSYFNQRNRQFKENEKFATGTVSHDEFYAMMGVEEDKGVKKSWNNLDWNLLKIVPRYFQSLVGGFMEWEETPEVKATDILSQEYKALQKQLARYRMENKERIAMMEQAGGMQLESDFTPQDEDELELYYKMRYRLPEEMFFGQALKAVMENSDYQNLKRLLVGDLIKKNMAVVKLMQSKDRNKTLGNRLRLRWCKPDRTVYNIFESPIGRDVRIIGEAYPIDITEGRRRFPGVSEKDWHTLAQKTTQGRNLLNPLGPWEDQFTYAFSRPYDTYKFDIFDFEVGVADTDYYVEKTNENGREVLIKKKGKPEPQNGEAVSDTKINIYCGVWAVDTDIMLSWELATNMIRPYQNGYDCLHSYTIVMPDANGMLVPSLMERGTSVVRQMVLCSLKVQQMMLEMRPDGIAIDIAGLQSLDLGTGAKLTPMEITKIYKAKGDIYWDSTDVTGTNGEGNPMPFQNLPNGGNVAQINGLIALYNFWLARLNDEWGTNPDALGMPVPARRSVGVNANMIQQANRATQYIYDFYTMLMEQAGKKVLMKLWDILVFDAKDYKQMDGIDEKLINMEFDVSLEMIPVQENRQRLQEKINIALEKGLVSLGQAIRLENMDDVKDAELYLIKLEKVKEKEAAASQQASIQMNAQVQEQSLKAKAQADSMVMQNKQTGEAQLQKSKIEGDSYNLVVKMVTDALIESQKTNIPLPENLRPFVDFVMSTTIGKEQQALQEEAAAQQAAQQQAAQQQAQQQQQNPQAPEEQGEAQQGPEEEQAEGPQG